MKTLIRVVSPLIRTISTLIIVLGPLIRTVSALICCRDERYLDVRACTSARTHTPTHMHAHTGTRARTNQSDAAESLRCPHLRRDWAHPRSICAADWAHICAGTAGMPGSQRWHSVASPPFDMNPAVSATATLTPAPLPRAGEQSRRRCGQGQARSRRRCGQG